MPNGNFWLMERLSGKALSIIWMLLLNKSELSGWDMLQMIFAGIRIALGLSWTTLVAAEMLAADAGLGYMILMGRQFARPDIIVLGMVVIGTIGAVFSAVLSALEKRLEHWRAGR